VITHFDEFEPFQVWVFDDSNYDQGIRWVVYLVDQAGDNVVSSRVLAASNKAEEEFGSWFCFQKNSWIDISSTRIT